ncbi:unnamed protein product, partial [Heterosigma akashiwo]
PGRTSWLTHRIHTSRTSFVKPYTLAQTELDKAETICKEMEEQGIIKRSNSSEFNSPVLLIQKKDGTSRFVLDLKRLNSVSVPVHYPCDNRRSCFDALGGGSFYFTQLDVLAAYWSIPIHSEDTHKTAFTVRNSKYEFLVCPFGLTSSPYSWAMLINIFLNKCKFATGECEFLGHIVGRDRLKCDPKKVEAVTKLARPETKKLVRTFLGMAGYYRAMIPNFSIIASPLHSLTRLSSPNHVVWNEACEESFNKLKHHILTSQPVLQFPNWTKDFYLECDASRTGIGAVLMQEVGDGMKAPIAYTSRLTTSAEKNYSVYDLELLSVVHACQRFRQYIYGRHIKIFSDHVALRFLLSLKRPSGRLARWLMILSELDYSIHYKRGVDNKVADSLSRL